MTPAFKSLALGAMVALSLLPAAVRAEGSASSPGPNGIKIGEGRLHPYFDAELRYDSAAGFFGGTPTDLQLAPELIAHFRPGVKFELASPGTSINFNGNVSYVAYTGWLNPASKAASHLETDIGLATAFNRDRQLELDIGDTLVRSDRTTNPVVGVGVLSLSNRLIVAAPIRPAGGALEMTPSVAWAAEFFQPLATGLLPHCDPTDPTCSGPAIQGMNYNNYTFGLANRWRFLPKTALVLDATLDTRSYASTANPSALLLNISAGLAGLVSSRVAVVLKAGYGRDLSDSGLSTVIGQAEATYLLSETSNLKFGYSRASSPVPIYGVLIDDRGYFEAKMLLGGKLTLLGRAAFDYLSYFAKSGRNDTLLTAGIGPEYEFTPWLIGGLAYNLSSRGSNIASTGALSGISVSGVTYTRHEVIARLTFTY